MAAAPVEHPPATPPAAPRRAARWPVLKVVTVGGQGGSGVGGGAVAPGRAVLLNRAVCVVGARSAVHLPLPSPLVSRTHALVVTDRTEGVVYVRDLASRNHVYRNGEPVREAALAGADLLRIGPVAFACAAGFDVAPAGDADRAGGPNGADALNAELVAGSGALRYPIRGRTLLLGRRPECDVVVDDVAVSAVHAVVFRRDGKHYVRDLNSAYGVAVNGTKVREVELRAGDDVRVGPARFRYETAADRLSADDLVALDDAGHLVESTAGLASRHDLGGQTVTTGFGTSAAGGEKLNGMATLGEIHAGDGHADEVNARATPAGAVRFGTAPGEGAPPDDDLAAAIYGDGEAPPHAETSGPVGMRSQALGPRPPAGHGRANGTSTNGSPSHGSSPHQPEWVPGLARPFHRPARRPAQALTVHPATASLYKPGRTPPADDVGAEMLTPAPATADPDDLFAPDEDAAPPPAGVRPVAAAGAVAGAAASPPSQSKPAPAPPDGSRWPRFLRSLFGGRNGRR